MFCGFSIQWNIQYYGVKENREIAKMMMTMVVMVVAVGGAIGAYERKRERERWNVSNK